MEISKKDVDEIIDLLWNEKPVRKEILEEINRLKLAEYFQGRILKKVLKNNPEFKIDSFDITLRIIGQKTKIKKKKKFNLDTGGLLFGSHKFCNYQSKELPSFGFALIPIIHQETFEKKIVIFPMGAKMPIQNIASFQYDQNNKTLFLTNSLYCKDLYIILIKIHD